VKGFHMELQITSDISHVKGFHMNMKLQITSEISHVKRFHMKLQVKFHMWKDKDFTWSYKLQSEISHVRERS
jgi:hypothetical protein